MYKKIAAAILAVLVVLLLKNQFSPKLMMNQNYGMPALIKKGSVDRLYVGSSMFRQSLDVRTLETENPAEHYVLAYNGNQPVFEYIQLKNLLDHGVQIKQLYVDMYVNSLCSPPNLQDEKMLMELNLWQKKDVWELIKPEVDNKLQSAYDLFVGGNNEILLTWPISAPVINSQFYKGGSLTQTTGMDAEQGEFVLSNLPISNNQQKEALEKMMDLAEEYDIEVFFIETPKFRSTMDSPVYLERMKEYYEFLVDYDICYIMSDTTANAVIDSSNTTDQIQRYAFAVDNRDYFMDGIHLSTAGKLEFSRIIGGL